VIIDDATESISTGHLLAQPGVNKALSNHVGELPEISSTRTLRNYQGRRIQCSAKAAPGREKSKK
jgi:hypothetical protein